MKNVMAWLYMPNTMPKQDQLYLAYAASTENYHVVYYTGTGWTDSFGKPLPMHLTSHFTAFTPIVGPIYGR